VGSIHARLKAANAQYMGSSDRLPGPRSLDRGYVDPRHAHHCIHCALRRRLIGVGEGFEKCAGDDLPR
jgi:hypothetical protein